MIIIKFLLKLLGSLVLGLITPVLAFHDLFCEIILNKGPLEYKSWL